MGEVSEELAIQMPKLLMPQKAQKNARPPVENHGERAFCVLLFVPL
ncbi:hypothetical protein [Faecalibacterium prausnitzii]|nr:hypothetical protein [Faecalibacterium prausnitzii]